MEERDESLGMDEPDDIKAEPSDPLSESDNSRPGSNEIHSIHLDEEANSSQNDSESPQHESVASVSKRHDTNTLPGNASPVPRKKTRGKQKIQVRYIQERTKRLSTFCKRKTGLMSKSYELAELTGAEVMLLIASETGHVYTYATKNFQPMITSHKGKAIISDCIRGEEPQLVADRMWHVSEAPPHAGQTVVMDSSLGPVVNGVVVASSVLPDELVVQPNFDGITPFSQI